MTVNGIEVNVTAISGVLTVITCILYFLLQTIDYVNTYDWLRKISIFLFIIFIIAILY